MTLVNDQQLANTQEKLGTLQARYEELKSDHRQSAHLREMTMRSLKRLINQLKEEIARYKTHQPAQK